jgi:hypothetical protein
MQAAKRNAVAAKKTNAVKDTSKRRAKVDERFEKEGAQLETLVDSKSMELPDAAKKLGMSFAKAQRLYARASLKPSDRVTGTEAEIAKAIVRLHDKDGVGGATPWRRRSPAPRRGGLSSSGARGRGRGARRHWRLASLLPPELFALGALRSTTSASKLHDAGCARCYDDYAAERGGDEQGDAKRELAVEDQERNGHFLQVLQDEDKHENE